MFGQLIDLVFLLDFALVHCWFEGLDLRVWVYELIAIWIAFIFAFTALVIDLCRDDFNLLIDLDQVLLRVRLGHCSRLVSANCPFQVFGIIAIDWILKQLTILLFNWEFCLVIYFSHAQKLGDWFEWRIASVYIAGLHRLLPHWLALL